ncbi:sugar ABC transporter substrate-binding protein, partial [Streptomyces bottropensis]
MAVTAVLGLAVGLSGCGGSADAESKPVSLTVVATNYGDSVRKNSEGYWDRVTLAWGGGHPGLERGGRGDGPAAVGHKGDGGGGRA